MGCAIDRLLIANRGEIAVRVTRACRELGIEVAALHLPGEAGEQHVRLADATATIPSFLDANAILSAAAAMEADAIHPGYGYLAENSDFAERVDAAGITWIGPPAPAMRAAGDKLAARRLAEAAGVPVVPGYGGVDLTDATLTSEAVRLGFPLLVKAAGGGGGRGIRRVVSPADIEAALLSSRREAQAAFGDDRVYLERELESARHVEVQLLADRHGNVIHLGERDCSAQRRHQKIVEEAPSPAVDAELRAELGAAAVAIARAAGYESAGTAEFLLLADGGWYFLELNARLQVEHPVTELVTGIDLVRAQLAIASGERLEWAQSDISPVGHAIECRIYAEDPAAGFVPATGTLLRFEIPAWPGVRLDSGVQAGDTIGLHHDPMLAKVIAHAEDRDACIERMTALLRAAVVLGVATNLGFLHWLLTHPRWAAGEVDTGFVERSWSAELVPPLPADIARAAAVALLPAGPWRDYGDPATVPVTAADGFVLHDGWQYTLGDDDEPSATAAASGSLQAPMPGTVLRVSVAAGDTVRAGQELIVIEAMKMELAVTAPRDGRVHAVSTTVGAQVARNQTLVAMDD
jgi:acetyl/propionyl-CoA carboxylase alpha subunit